MTGEMSSIDKNGLDSNGDAWPIQAALAKAFHGKLHPFDKYQGPYIQTKHGTLWLCCTDGDTCTVYNETTDKESSPFPLWHDDGELAAAAIGAAKETFAGNRKFRCADPDCAGHSYKASDQPHLGTCKR